MATAAAANSTRTDFSIIKRARAPTMTSIRYAGQTTFTMVLPGPERTTNKEARVREKERKEERENYRWLSKKVRLASNY